MRFVLSGASGLIGRALVDLITKKGHSVTILTSASNSSCPYQQSDLIHLYKCTLDSYQVFSPDFIADVFIHLAWVGGSSRTDIYANQASMMASVDAVTLASRLGCHSFIGIGSQAEYGVSTDLLTPSSACCPVTAFGAAKLSSMFNCSFRCSELGLRFAWARVFSVYGPYDRSDSLVTSTINSLIVGRPLAFTKADNIWDFLHVSDAAYAIYLLGLHETACGIYNVASGIGRPLHEFIECMCSAFGVSASPFLGLVNHSSSIVSLNADISRLNRDFGWAPLVDFDTGIQSLITFQKKSILGF